MSNDKNTGAFAMIKTMKKRRRPVTRTTKLITLALIVIAAGGAYTLYLIKGTSQPISGTVTGVVDKPNRVEDGYRALTVQTAGGKQFTVDYTGYLDTPLSPQSQGQACIGMPSVAAGDKVSFNLPKDKYRPDTFDICYKVGAHGYYFRIDNPAGSTGCGNQGKIIVQFGSSSAEQQQAIINQEHATILQDYSNLPGLYVLNVPAGQEQQAVAAFKLHPEVQTADLDRCNSTQSL